jgi:hypothetical protein
MFWGAPPILARFAWDSPSFAARERDTPPPRVMARAIGRAGRKRVVDCNSDETMPGA